MKTPLSPIQSALLVTLTAATLVVGVGCSNTITGNASEASAGAGVSGADLPYASLLDDDDLALVTEFANIRALDPCGFVDEAVIKKLGVVRKFDASTTIQDCSIDITVDREDYEKSLEAKVRIVPKLSGFAEGTKTVTVAGEEILEKTEDYPDRPANLQQDTCYNVIPFTETSSLLVSVFRRTKDAACTEAHTLTESVLARRDAQVLRKDSTKKALHAIAMADPCAALSTIGKGHEVKLATLFGDPWACGFSLTGDEKDVDHLIKLTTNLKAAFDDPYSAEKITIDGNPAYKRSHDTTCMVEVAVGDPADGVTYEPVGDTKYITNTISVIAPTCERGVEVAKAAIKAFLTP